MGELKECLPAWECLRMDSERVNTATSPDVAGALTARWLLNERMVAALDRDFVNHHREREIPLLVPQEYDIIIRALLLRMRRLR